MDVQLIAAISRLVDAKGGHKTGTTFSRELSRLVRLGLQVETTQKSAELTAPAVQEIIDSRMAALELWLRPLVAKSGIYAATATLMALELLTGHRIQRDEAKPFLELIRGRGYRLFRRPDDPEGVPQAQRTDER